MPAALTLQHYPVRRAAISAQTAVDPEGGPIRITAGDPADQTK
jgi:hypothetical protein